MNILKTFFLASTLMAGPAFAASDVVKVHCTMDTQIKRDRSFREMVTAYTQERNKDNFLFPLFVPVFAQNSFNAGIETIDLEYSKSEKKGLIVHTQLVRGPFNEGVENEGHDKLNEVLEKNTSYIRVTQLAEQNRVSSKDLAQIKEEISSLPKKLGWQTTYPTQKGTLGLDSLCFPQTKMGKSCIARNSGVNEARNYSLIGISALGRFSLGKNPAQSKLDSNPIKCKIVEGDVLLSEKQIAQDDKRAKQLKDAWELKQNAGNSNDPDLPVDASLPPY